MSASRPLARTAAALGLVALVGGAVALAAPARADAAPVRPVRPVDDDTLAGRSGKLRARFLLPSPDGMFAYLRRLLGDSVSARSGVYTARVDGTRRPFTYIALLPFAEKVDGRIGRYRIGFWPGERGRGAARGGDKYGPPAGFIQVTRENAATPVSEHFRLRDFLTHDQGRVWPKYLVLDEALVDKLELVISDLRARGYRADRLHVMSGFRTPQYNRGGGDPRGRAELSRHQYGDAADVAFDVDGDGRFSAFDAQVAGAMTEMVERRHPELTGGLGLYTNGRSPYVHLDVRGRRARWWKR